MTDTATGQVFDIAAHELPSVGTVRCWAESVQPNPPDGTPREKRELSKRLQGYTHNSGHNFLGPENILVPKTSPEKLAFGRAWRAANPQRQSELSQRWRAENSDYNRAQKREWKRANREKVRAYESGRDRKNKMSRRARLMELQGGRCAYCRVKLGNDNHIDHIMPRFLGGTNHFSNLQLTCPPCNLTKGAQHPVAFAQSIGRLI